VIPAIPSLADTAARVAGESSVFAGWHEFYLLTGTAAVTLVGLLFVSLSFNLDVLLHESKTHVLSHARQTMLSFVFVLIASLEFLVPGLSPRILGVWCAAFSLIFLVLAVASLARTVRSGDDSRHSGFLHRRGRIFIGAYALSAILGVAMFGTRDGSYAYAYVTVMGVILANAVGSAWDLLVEVGRLRIRQQAESPPRA
jgi:hypothetical protein